MKISNAKQFLFLITLPRLPADGAGGILRSKENQNFDVKLIVTLDFSAKL